MTVSELLAAIENAAIPHDTEVFGPRGPLQSVHLEDGVLVLDETDATLVRKLTRSTDAQVLWGNEELTAA